MYVHIMHSTDHHVKVLLRANETTMETNSTDPSIFSSTAKEANLEIPIATSDSVQDMI